jgi:hypothetical protein
MSASYDSGRRKEMSALSYREFMEEAKGRLAILTHDDLLNLIINWADKTPSSKRQELLDELAQCQKSES